MAATPRFNANLLAAARRLQDERALATDNGLRYSSELLSFYQNASIRDIIREMWVQHGVGVVRSLPEMINRVGPLAIDGDGMGSVPSGSYQIISLITDETTPVPVQRVFRDLSRLDAGLDSLQGTAENPIFIQVERTIYLKGKDSVDVKGYALSEHIDIAPSYQSSEGSDSNVMPAAGGSWTAATRTLVATMDHPFTAADVGKIITLGLTTVCYLGTVESFVDASTVVLKGTDLATFDLAPLQSVHLSGVRGVGDDIPLSAVWDSHIVDRMVAYGHQDAKVAISV